MISHMFLDPAFRTQKDVGKGPCGFAHVMSGYSFGERKPAKTLEGVQFVLVRQGV